MTRRKAVQGLAAASLVWCVAPFAKAQDWARSALDKSPRHREYVPIKTAAGRTVNTFVVYPEVAGKAPAVLLIHEIFGLSDWAKLMADELAAKGYIVLAPDLLSGTGPGAGGPAPGQAGVAPTAAGDVHAEHAHSEGAAAQSTSGHMPNQPGGGTDAYPSVDAITKAVSGLPPEQVLADLDAVADYAQRKIAAADGSLAVAGFCWGGGKTFAFATHRSGLRGAFVFYGPPPAAADMAHITAPVYGFYAGNDARITATVPQTIADMKAAGKRFEPVTYEGAGHGFMRAGQEPEPTEANRKAWQEGFARLTELLGHR